MEMYHNTVQDASGNIINGAVVTVTLVSSGANATIYDKDNVALSNPFNSGYQRSKGETDFKAADGIYNVQIVSGDTVTIYAVGLFDYVASGISDFSSIATAIDSTATASKLTITDTEVTFSVPIVAPVTTVQTHLITTSSQSITSGTRANISGLNATITPTSTSKRIKVTVRWNGEFSHINNHSSTFGIKRDSIDIGNPAAAGSRHVGISIIAQGYFNTNADSTPDSAMYSYIDSPATTSATTYHATFIQVETGTLYNQRTVSDTDFNTRQRLTSTIILEEID
jgi:hypothetical protein